MSQTGDLLIQEAAPLHIAEGAAPKEAGNVLVHLMRPCVGKGRGRHIYEADMLARHADSGHFDDWPMFVDHQAPGARRKAEGLPRSLRDAGGRVVRTYWDPAVQESVEDGFGRGAAIAEVKPVPWVKELIDHDPKLVNVSLNTFATGVRPGTYKGRRGNVVEGFEPKGSADWVTIPGAGGKVIELMEAAAEHAEPDEDLGVLEAVSDAEMVDHIRATRPHLAEALNLPGPGEQEVEMEPHEITEAALESLRSDAGQTLISEAVETALAEHAGPAVQEALKAVLPDAIGAAAAKIEEGAKAAASAEVRRGRMRETAAKDIAEAKLPERFGGKALDNVTAAIADIADKVEDGEVTESAEAQAKAITEAEIKEQFELVGSIDPTRVSGNGGGSSEDTTATTKGGGGEYRRELSEAGIDVKAAYGVKDKDAEEKKEPKAEPEAAAA